MSCHCANCIHGQTPCLAVEERVKQARAEGAAEEREACAKWHDDRRKEHETGAAGLGGSPIHYGAAAAHGAAADWVRARGEAPDAIREHVKEGLADSAAGRVSSLGSFAKYADDDAKDEALAEVRRLRAVVLETSVLLSSLRPSMKLETPAQWEALGAAHNRLAGACGGYSRSIPADDAKEKALAALCAIEPFLPTLDDGPVRFSAHAQAAAQVREAIAALTTKG